MSAVITMQLVPSTANGPWEVIDDRLLNPTGDWVLLRRPLIHMICARVTNEGDPVTRLEEELLVRFFANSQVRLGFLDALVVLRGELSTWSEPVRWLVEHALAGSVHRAGNALATNEVSLSLDDIRRLAQRTGAPPAEPRRSLGDVYQHGLSRTATGEEDRTS